ncbi:MAG: amidohydrolase family protein, partial [Gemmatimonadetes bacterium]|nr:amidohydrolase family protein [Gemmatimonadota bacterium]
MTNYHRLTVLASCTLVLTALGLAVPPGLVSQTAEENDSSASAARSSNSLPLIPTRTLDFTTDEGTWISLDLSPDGQAIVFELLGDLYTLPIQGGEATRITNGPGYDMQPRYSPDGTKIVFVSDRDGSENLWISAADGTDPRQLTDGERENHVSPEWTPDGEYVMAAKGTQLWLYHEQGGSGVQITGHGGEDGPPPPAHFGAAFGDDPRYVWVNVRGNLGGGFVTSVDVGAGDDVPFGPDHEPRSSARQIGGTQIGVLDRESGRVLVRTHEHEGAFRPMPSPDGRWLVYATRYDDRPALRLRDLQTGDESWLVMDVQRDDSQGGGRRDRDLYPGGSWTPDSQALLTTWGGKIMRVSVPSGEAVEVPFSARVQQELGPLVKFDYPINDSLLTVSQIRGTRPSPDGSRIAFTALDRIWTAQLPEASGTETEGFPVLDGAQRLTAGTDVEHAPVWSPDARWVAFVTWNDSTGGDIWRTRADGSGSPERLTPTSAFFDRLAYSQDGTRILAVRGSRMHRMRTLEDFGRHSGAAELEYVWLPADGGEPQRITWVGAGTTQEGRNAPHIGPDPARVYVWAGRDGLLSMRYDGTDVRTVVKVTAPSRPGPGTPPAPDEVVLSPDGSRALVRASRNIYLITVPPVGGEAPTVSVASSSSMPTRRLTRVGGDFVGWSLDGRIAHYSIGKSFFRYDVELADSLVADSVNTARAEAAARGDEEAGAGDDAAAADSATAGEAGGDDEESAPAYQASRFDVEITVPKDRPQGVVALTGARLITMRGDEVIERGDIVVRDNRIVSVGPTGSVEIPDDARVMDMTGRTIYPGLVDIHAHTWVAWGVHRGQISQFLAQLAYGVTTQRDPQTSSEDVVTYSDLMETGAYIGPRIYSTGPGIFGADQISSLDEARDVLRRYSDHYNTQTIKQYLAGDRKVRQWVIMAARELGLTPTTEGGSNFTMNLTLAQDGYAGLEHSLPISPFYDDVARLGAFSGMVYTPTFIVAYGGPSGRQYYLTRTDMHQVERLRTFTPHDELDKWKATQWYRDDQYPHFLHAEQLKKWMDAGGQAGLGSHGEVQGLGTHWELWMMASGGMDNHQALQMATLMSADAIGLAGDLGSLEAGKLADLQILGSNPLDDLENSVDIDYVMKNGRLYEADTLTEIWPRERALPTQWWWRLEP